MQKRNFREDLFYRINVFPIKIPSLEERIEDIDELVDFLLPNICERVGTELKRVSEEAMVKLMRYPWPGNIRELENVLERAVNLCEESNILSNHIEITEKKLKVRANKDFVRPIRDISKNLLPYLVSVIMLRLALAIPLAIGSEVFLTYIGLGHPVDIPSLGNLINEGRIFMMVPSLRYQLLFPAVVLSIITISFYVMGNAFADASDPKNHI